MGLLVVEDEHRTRDFVAGALRAVGLVVDTVSTGEEALVRAGARRYDLVLLDLMLPGVDGLALLERLRAGGSETPVLVVSARDDLRVKLRAFDLGAEDYLAKPFALDELLARVRVHLRRSRPRAVRDQLTAGRLALDAAAREVRVGDTTWALTDTEFRLLRVLVEHAGEVVSRQQLLQRVWGYDFDPRSNVVDVGVRRLRRRLGESVTIDTIRGAGYRLLVD